MGGKSIVFDRETEDIIQKYNVHNNRSGTVRWLINKANEYLEDNPFSFKTENADLQERLQLQSKTIKEQQQLIDKLRTNQAMVIQWKEK
jgi:hypothetical protein